MNNKLRTIMVMALMLAGFAASAQYTGGSGRGDHMNQSGIMPLSGFDAMFNGGIGRGDYMAEGSGLQILSCTNPTAGGTIAAAQTICYGTAPAAFTSESLPTGHTGTLEYQWQLNTSTPTATWLNIDISGTHTITYNHVGTLTQTTWFRRLARVDCMANWDGAATSEPVKVTVHPQFTAGEIKTDGETICYNTAASEIGSETAASGGDENITYSWKSSADNYVAPIDGATGETYTPPALTETTAYRRYANDGTCNTEPEVSAGTWTVTVRDEFTPGEIASTGQTICYNTAASEIGSETAASGGHGAIEYTWRSSVDNFATSTHIDGATLESYTPGTLTQTTTFRRYATNADCNTTPVQSAGEWTVTVQRLQQFRSIASGNWITASNWEQYTGVGDEWITATEYPGQNPNSCLDNPLVTIRPGNEMEIAPADVVDIPNLKIEANGKLTIKSGGKLIIQKKLQLDEQVGAAIVVEHAAPSTWQPCPDMPTVTDIDENIYNTVQIGNQCWMKENLRVTNYNNGAAIQLTDTWQTTTSGAYAIYDHNNWDAGGINSPEEMVAAYGKLYNWYAVDDARGLCPVGWSVPGHDDWTQLEQYICNALGNSDCETLFPDDTSTMGFKGTNEGNALKSCRQVDHPGGGDCDTSEHPRWNSHGTHHGFDEFYFSAFPGGSCTHLATYQNVTNSGWWWSSTERNDTEAWNRTIFFSNGGVSRFPNNKRSGFSVRCIKDTAIECPLPAAPTATAATGVTTNTFNANWTEVTGAVTYTLQVALDEDFLGFVDGYEALEVVDATSHSVGGLSPNTTYYYRVKATNTCGTSEYSNTVNIRTYCVTSPVSDIDDNVYQTVIINGREWMAENLRVTRYNNGDVIPTGLSDAGWLDTTEGAYAIYDHTAENTDGIDSPAEMVAAYGKLYNWYAVADVRGLCPTGWRVATADEWTELLEFIDDQGYPNEFANPNGAGNALKSCRQVDHPDGGDCNTSGHPRWDSHTTHSGFDKFCFSALPGGERGSTHGNFDYVGRYGYWWSATESDALAHGRYMMKMLGYVATGTYSKRSGFSVRCIKDTD